MSSIRLMIFVSIGLHTIFLGIWGVLPRGIIADPEDREVISIVLVAQALPNPKDPAEQVESSPPPSALRSAEIPFRTSPPEAVSPAHINQVTQTMAPRPSFVQEQPPSDVESSAKAPESVSFVELPRIVASRRMPGIEIRNGAAALLDVPTTIYEADLPMDAPRAVNRPALGPASEARLLRDTTPYDVHQARSKVKMADNATPDYPRPAREAGWEGTVMLRVEVLPNGSAGRVTLQKSSGHPMLDEAALTAVQRWRFVPALDGHFPVRSLVDLPIRFDLSDRIP